MIYVSPDLTQVTTKETDGYFSVDVDIYSFNIDFYKIDEETNTLVEKTEEEMVEDASSARERILYLRIQNIISEKMKESQNNLAQKFEVPSDQIERYRAKYDLAKVCKESGDYSPFDFESNIQNVSSQDLAESIIQMGDAWYATINLIYTKLDGLRIKLESYISSKTDEEWESIFIAVEKLNTLTMTDEDLEAI